MSAPAASDRAGRLDPRDGERLAARLRWGFRADGVGGDALANQHLLDALDRGEYSRFVVWPEADPLGVLFIGRSGSVMPAGDPTAAPALADAAERAGWRVLLGDAAVCQALLAAGSKGVLRRRPWAREQRFMVATTPAGPPRMDGLRRALPSELERLTDFACRLHVEDRMGPPISRTGRSAVRARMHDSVADGATWVVERGGRAVAKVDLPLYSRRRGAQVAGVYVDEHWRGQGIATEAMRALVALILADGLPGITLHARSDNAPAIAAYARAGFVDQGAWTLALR